MHKNSITLISALFTVCAWADNTVPPGPPGSPESSMKTLNEVEPRTLISALPFTITNSGAYYVTRDLVGTNNADGITIRSSHVQLDLNGFVLMGMTNLPGSVPNNTLNGILIDNSEIFANITIRNGVLHNWGRNGIRSGLAKDCRLAGITASFNGDTNQYDGISLGDSWMVSDCLAANNSGNGISMQSRCTVTRTLCRQNGKTGLKALSDCRFVECTAMWNAEDGIAAGAETVIQNCAANSNSSNGIHTADGAVIKDCHCAFNGNSGTGAGILASEDCRIERNHLRKNQFGVQIPTGRTKSLLIQNSAVMNTIRDFDLPDGTHFGIILSNDVLRANFTNSTPWANFSL